MKNFIGVFIFLLIVNFAVPVVYHRVYSSLPSADIYIENTQNTTKENRYVTLMDSNTKQILEIPLKDYLIGAAACEMPALYSEEAIKAQMVAAHSYYLYAEKHPDWLEKGYITVDTKNMKGYADSSRLMEFWQMDYYTYYEKFKKCAEEVMDMVVTYDGQPALTSYYAVSCGKTADSKDVWGQELPYLVSVDSSQDQISESYVKVTEIPKDNMYSLLRINYPNIDIDNLDAEQWFGDIIYTESGYASYVTVGSDLVPAGQIRDVMKLPSTCLMIFYEDEIFSIATKGYGHGVGLSQFGANSMATQGKNYQDILSHYFPGTKVEKLSV